MSIERYALGLLALTLCTAPLVAGALRLRARLLPGWDGAPARVAEGTAFAGLFVVALELAGVTRLFTVVGVALAAWLVSAGAWALAARVAPEPAQSAAGGGAGPAAALVAAGAVAVVGAAWASGVVYAYANGMETVDTLWYHLPQAARFVQEGGILGLHYTDRDPVTAFYPENSVLFHALGLLAFDRDVASPLVDLGWAALALTAAFAIGRPYAKGPHCVALTVLLLGTPTLVDTQPGGAYNDVTCIALLLAAAALLVNGGLRPVPSALAAMAAGLALGTKFTMIAPVGLLAIGVLVVTARGERGRQLLIWAGGLLLFGGLWYGRNLVAVGNPLPSLALGSLPSPGVTTHTESVAAYLFDRQVWSDFYLPGLRRSMGLAWWAILAFAGTGMVLALLRGPTRVARMLGAVGLLGVGAYVVTPQFLGLPGLPIFFVANVRYSFAPLVLGLALLPILAGIRGTRPAGWLLGLAAVALVATEIDPSIWPTGFDWERFADPVHGGPALAGGLLAALGFVAFAAWLVLRGRAGGRFSPPAALPANRRAVLSAAALGLALAVAGWLVADAYEEGRYGDSAPMPRIYAWANDVQDARIGYVGVVQHYPFYGRDVSNYVQTIGEPRPDKGFGTITSCPGWRRAVNEGGYDWLVLTPLGFPVSSEKRAPESAWTRGSPAVRRVLVEEAEAPVEGNVAELYRVEGRLDPDDCPVS